MKGAKKIYKIHKMSKAGSRLLCSIILKIEAVTRGVL